MAKSRRETLEWLYGVTEAAIVEAPADKRSPLIGQMRAIALELEQLGASDAPVERNGLIDFQAALAERQQSAPKGARRSTH